VTVTALMQIDHCTTAQPNWVGVGLQAAGCCKYQQALEGRLCQLVPLRALCEGVAGPARQHILALVQLQLESTSCPLQARILSSKTKAIVHALHAASGASGSCFIH
jgi:hypothetical protein